MQKITEKIWNRACGINPSSVALNKGDQTLAALIAFHSIAMNGGFLHAVTTFQSMKKTDSAIDGYRFFDFGGVVDLILQTIEELAAGAEAETMESLVGAKYGVLVPVDLTLVDRFELFYSNKPDLFASI